MGSDRGMRRFWSVLAGITVLGLVIRLIAIYSHGAELGFSDPLYYYAQGRALGKGYWFINAVEFYYSHKQLPSAVHPPLYTSFLGVVSWIGVTSIRGQEVATGLLGTATIIVTALAARRVAGDRAGWCAAFIVAVYPNFWSTDRLLLSETMGAFVAAALVLFATAYSDRPSRLRAFAVGTCIALLALTRAEGVLLAILLGVPLFVRARSLDRRSRARDGAIALGALVLFLGPWIGFNLARFKEPTFISTNDGGVLADSYCSSTFNGPKVGWWDEQCLPLAPPGDESQQDRVLRRQAIDYMRAHKKAIPRVVAFRVGRLVQVYAPWQTALLDGGEGRGLPAARAGAVGWFVLMPLGIAGFFVAAARKRPVLPMASLVLASVVTAAVFYGSPRFRVVGEVGLVVAAGVTLDACWLVVRRARPFRGMPA